MKKLNLSLRIGLFSLILLLGTAAALVVGETRSLAVADLSNMPVEAMTQMGRSDTIYAALGGERPGIYRSSNGGHYWQIISAGPKAPITALAIHPLDKQTWYAGAKDSAGQAGGKLWYSEDAGRSWDYTRLALPAGADNQQPVVTSLAVTPDQPDVVYAGTEGQGLYRLSVPDGTSEQIGGGSLANLHVKDIVTSPDGWLYAVAAEGLLAIRGKSAQMLESLPDAAVSLAVDPAQPDTLYAGTVGYGAFRSSDGGQSWEAINTGLNWQPGIILRVSAITVDKANPEHLALATAYGVGSQVIGDGIYESFDAGQSWQKAAESSPVVEQLTIKDDGIYAATVEGVMRYAESQQTSSAGAWEQLYLLANPSGVQMLILVLTLVFAGWVLAGGLIWRPGLNS
jgi:hypothetical protein